MKLNRGIASLATALSLLLTPFCASAQDGSEDWHHSLYIYGMGAAIDGTAQIGPVEVPVDLSTSDVFDALEFGAMAAYRAENDKLVILSRCHVHGSWREAIPRKVDS